MLTNSRNFYAFTVRTFNNHCAIEDLFDFNATLKIHHSSSSWFKLSGFEKIRNEQIRIRTIVMKNNVFANG